jgi:chromosome segregation ATPase
MISDDSARQLHDKATRGESLSAEQQSLLENWYALQDRDENNTLGLASDEKTLNTLQAQVEAALIQVATIAKRIQEVASENEALKREIAILRHQLSIVVATFALTPL